MSKIICRVANKSETSWQQVVVMEFGKWHDTTDTTDFCPCQLAMNLLQGNWCNGLWENLLRRCCYGLGIYAADLLWTS